MVTTAEIEAAVDVLRSFGAVRIVLFGSAAVDPSRAHDLDLACEGIEPARFIRAGAEVGNRIGRDIDLIDLGRRTPFTAAVERGGRTIYVQR